MASPAIDVNKGTIMEMLRTDVFGFAPDDIESKAKEVYHLVSDGSGGAKGKVGDYVRSKDGFIIISPVKSRAAKKK